MHRVFLSIQTLQEGMIFFQQENSGSDMQNKV